MNDNKITARDIQLKLYNYLIRNGKKCIVPNIWISLGEADLICLTKANYLMEYEIKITRADFKKDFTHKTYKHAVLSRQVNYKYDIHQSYFSYAVPEGLVEPSEVPEYAGLVYIGKTSIPTVIKKAPKIGSFKISTEMENTILRGCMYRMWNMAKSEDKSFKLISEKIKA